jgi:thiamine biosynthesis lipoprotein
MGTLVSLTLLHLSRERAEEALGAALGEMERVVRLLDRFDSASAVSCLNDQGSLAGPPPELTQVMQRAQRLCGLSGGAFDVTVKPLVDLLRRRGLGSGTAPEGASVDPLPSYAGGGPDPRVRDPELAEACGLVDGRGVTVSPRRVRLGRAGMGVTLDGIAKGYVVDRMAGVLEARGLTDWLIEAGGDIRTAGRREDGGPWRIGVQDPAREGRLPEALELSGGAVATSGGYESFFDRERTAHHLVCADTGRSPGACRSVSVVAPSAMDADALATATFVMGPERGISFVDSLPQCACFIVDAAGRHLRSRRWRGAIPSSRKAGQT